MVKKPKKQNKLVVISNKLIEARYDLNLIQHKMLIKLISEININDVDFRDHDWRVKDTLGEFNMGIGHYSELKKAIDDMLKKVMEISEPDGLLKVNLLSSAKYYYGEGKIRLRFDPALKPYLLELKKKFTKFYLENVLKLKTTPGIRIYPLLVQYEKIGYRILEYKDLRRKLGIKEEEYKQYNDFKRYVILQAQKDIDAYTDIVFVFEEIKTGRKITAIKFTIKKNKKNYYKKENDNYSLEYGEDLEVQQLEITYSQYVEELLNTVKLEFRNYTSIEKIINDSVKKYSKDRIKRSIEYMNKNCNKNPEYYFKKSIENDWGLNDNEVQKNEERLTEYFNKLSKEEQDKIILDANDYHNKTRDKNSAFLSPKSILLSYLTKKISVK